MSSGGQGDGWLAVRVKPNFENTVDQSLQAQGFEAFLPRQPELRQWSDRLKQVQAPLFPGYLFCKSESSGRVPILKTPGVFGILGIGTTMSRVPDVEIESLRVLLQSGALARPFPNVHLGERVRIADGPLNGLEGTLLEIKNGYRIIVSITLLQRSIAAEVEADWVRPLHEVKRAS